MNEYWNSLNGNNVIDAFEKKWFEWTIDDTIRWFDFVLKCKDSGDSDHSDSDYEIHDCSSDESESERDDENENGSNAITMDMDEKKQEINDIVVSTPIDFTNVKIRMEAMEFRAKRDFGLILKPFQFKRFGFRNKNDCKLLFKQTQLLLKKYPKKSKNKSKKSKNKRNDIDDDSKQQENNFDDAGLEGFVQDTNH